MIRLILITLIVLMGTSFTAWAQMNRPVERQLDLTYVADANYENMVRQAYQQKPDNFKFDTLRSWYSQSSYYEPFPERLQEHMTVLSFQIDSAENDKAKEIALQAYRRLILEQLANIDIVMMAESLSRTNPVFGNPDFFAWARSGLMTSVMGSGTGASLNFAYDALTSGEEAMLMRTLNVTVQEQEMVEAGIFFVNIYRVTDNVTQQPRDIYVNVTFPIRHERKKAAESVRPDITIMPQ